MRLVSYLDKGASLGRDAPCLTMAGATLSYGEVQELTWRIGRALERSGVRPGDKVAILSANDALAFACVLAISRAGAVWCPINPRNEAAENRELLELFDCVALLFQPSFGPLVDRIAPDLPKLSTLVVPRRGASGRDAVRGVARRRRAQPLAGRHGRRRRDARRHRRHDGPAQGRGPDRPQPARR